MEECLIFLSAHRGIDFFRSVASFVSEYGNGIFIL